MATKRAAPKPMAVILLCDRPERRAERYDDFIAALARFEAVKAAGANAYVVDMEEFAVVHMEPGKAGRPLPPPPVGAIGPEEDTR